MVTVVVLTLRRLRDAGPPSSNKNYYVGAGLHRDLISPVLLPVPRRQLRARAANRRHAITWWTISPALLILIFPLGFRLTCYYYRKAYYRSFWWPRRPARWPTRHGTYTGETRFPLILQNIHRYFFYFGLVFNVHPDHRRHRGLPPAGPGRHRGQRRHASC